MKALTRILGPAKISGTARGENLDALHDDAKKQARDFYPDGSFVEIIMLEARADEVLNDWGESLNLTTFAAEYEASLIPPKEGK